MGSSLLRQATASCVRRLPPVRVFGRPRLHTVVAVFTALSLIQVSATFVAILVDYEFILLRLLRLRFLFIFDLASTEGVA